VEQEALDVVALQAREVLCHNRNLMMMMTCQRTRLAKAGREVLTTML
jgi:hypothetical protein